MSLEKALADIDALRFPRVSGDEPSSPQRLQVFTRFSPRERG